LEFGRLMLGKLAEPQHFHAGRLKRISRRS
jgi:hypothetical protein